MKTTKFLSLLLTATLTLASCGDDGDDIIISHGNGGGSSEAAVNSNKNTSGPAEAQYRLEFPKLKGGSSVVIVHKSILNKNTKDVGINYSVEWDYAINAQRWSCYQLYSSINYHSSYNVSRYSADNDGSLSSTCQYPNDPDLPAEYRFTSDPFKYSGYDHGHICPSADRQRATECNYQTFYITNMQPQYNKFNAGLWEKMEEDVRNWANKSDTLYVCKGGTIDKSSNILEYVFQSSHQSTKVNDKHIPVPKYFFMAVLSKKGSQWQAIGYWVEQVNADRSNDNRKNYAISIDELEGRTGIDFFCNLPDDIETKVEKSWASSYWF
jgi:endonuclease G